MRYLLAILATLALAQCVTKDDDRFFVGQSNRALVIIGVAEAAANTEGSYTLLWRKLDGDGRFVHAINDHTSFEARTNSGGTVRVDGTPGEFRVVEIDAGTYALDSVFAVIRDQRVNYIANGVVTGPDRPSFEARPGEAIYLGIWQARLDDVTAVTQLWRLDEADMRAAVREAGDVMVGAPHVVQTQTRAVACAPQRLNRISQRQVC